MKFILIGCICLIYSYSEACTCVGKDSTKEAVEKSDYVLAGSVVKNLLVTDTILIIVGNDTSKIFQTYREITLKVNTLFKGKKEKVIDSLIIVQTGVGNGDCGFHFVLNQNYIVYTEWMAENGKRPRVNSCSRTMHYNRREYDLIKKYCKPKKLR